MTTPHTLKLFLNGKPHNYQPKNYQPHNHEPKNSTVNLDVKDLVRDSTLTELFEDAENKMTYIDMHL